MKRNLRVVSRAGPPVDLERLAKMQSPELQQLHRRMFGTDVASGNTEQAQRRVAWRIQAEREGGLPDSARERALEIARGSGLRIRARIAANRKNVETPPRYATLTGLVSDHDPRLPMPGSVIVKEYRGRTLLVHVLDTHFEYDGRRFHSLSAIAREITGTKWNGFVFFGLSKGKLRGR
jgi:hypothetical protein